LLSKKVAETFQLSFSKQIFQFHNTCSTAWSMLASSFTYGSLVLKLLSLKFLMQFYPKPIKRIENQNFETRHFWNLGSTDFWFGSILSLERTY